MRAFARRAALALALAAAGSAAAAELRYVQVAETRLRREPSFLSPAVAVLRYGDQVQKLAEGAAGTWARVSREARVEGWVHSSAVTATRVALRPGEADASAGTSRSEPTLAGKGFSPETETDFKAKNPELDFAALDLLEAEVPSDDAVGAFAREGGLR